MKAEGQKGEWAGSSACAKKKSGKARTHARFFWVLPTTSQSRDAPVLDSVCSAYAASTPGMTNTGIFPCMQFSLSTCSKANGIAIALEQKRIHVLPIFFKGKVAWLPAITRRPRPSSSTVIRNKGRKERSRGMGWTAEEGQRKKWQCGRGGKGRRRAV